MPHKSFGHALAEKLVQHEFAHPSEFVGCSRQQIKAVIDAQRINQLPDIYCEFLEVLGQGAGALFADSEAFYPDLLDLKENANWLLDDDGNPFVLADDVFVFLMLRDKEFLYFHTGTATPETDPPVYQYTEGKSRPVVKWERLSQCLTHFIADAEGDSARDAFLRMYVDDK